MTMFRATDNSRDDRASWLMWLTRLRWVAIFAQVTTLAFVIGILDSPIVLAPLAVVEAVLVLGNLRALHILRTGTEVYEITLLWQLGLDVAALTAFFLLAGGADNPFVALYFIHIAMGAVMMRPREAALLTTSVVLCYITLHLAHLPLHYERHILPQRALVVFGQLAAFVITSASLTAFVVGLAQSLRHRKAQLLEARDRTARIDRLRSVGTLAAGAAHELNTPLSTIGLRLRRVVRRHDDPDTARDLEVMRSQLDRCVEVVRQLLVGAGDPSADELARWRLADLARETVKLWEKSTSLSVTLRVEDAELEVEAPRIAFCQALTNLLENARQAQETIGTSDAIEIVVHREGDRGVVTVTDHGCGLPDGNHHVGEPFFTTKAKGTGLGVFVARQVADGAGGGLRYSSPPSGGTIAHWWFPEAARRSL